jgi:anti-sigma factor ChrR (cupin superfamily)
MTAMGPGMTRIEARLREVSRRQAEQAEEIGQLEQDLATVKAAAEERRRVSPSIPLDAPHPSASLVIPD